MTCHAINDGKQCVYLLYRTVFGCCTAAFLNYNHMRLRFGRIISSKCVTIYLNRRCMKNNHFAKINEYLQLTYIKLSRDGTSVWSLVQVEDRTSDPLLYSQTFCCSTTPTPSFHWTSNANLDKWSHPHCMVTSQLFPLSVRRRDSKMASRSAPDR